MVTGVNVLTEYTTLGGMQGENVKNEIRGAKYRFLYLSHARRALYYLGPIL
jgi:hypothetical protein